MPKDSPLLDFDVLFPPAPEHCRLLVACPRHAYSASAIARAVEDCDAQVLNLNVTALPGSGSELIVEIRANHRSPEAISRSLARYDFEVIDAMASDDNATEEMRTRANELLRYLNV